MEARKNLPRTVPEETAHKALQKLQSDKELAVEGCRYMLIDEEKHNKMLKFLKENFVSHEPVCNYIGVSWTDDVDKAFLTQIQQNLSLAIVSEISGEIISGIVYMVVDKNFKFDVTDEKLRKLLFVVNLLDERCDIFQHFSVEEAVYIGEICTRADFRGTGLATRIMTACVSFLRHLYFHGAVLYAEGTSKFSQRVFEKCNFDILAEISFSECMDDGKLVCEKMGPHRSMKLYAKVI